MVHKHYFFAINYGQKFVTLVSKAGGWNIPPKHPFGRFVWANISRWAPAGLELKLRTLWRRGGERVGELSWQGHKCRLPGHFKSLSLKTPEHTPPPVSLPTTSSPLLAPRPPSPGKVVQVQYSICLQHMNIHIKSYFHPSTQRKNNLEGWVLSTWG